MLETGLVDPERAGKTSHPHQREFTDMLLRATGRSSRRAVQAAQKYAQEGKEWVDIDITKFLDRVPYCPLVIEKVVLAHRLL